MGTWGRSSQTNRRGRGPVAEFGTWEFAKAQRAHEEGVIAKRSAGLYYSGKRTREWLKFKAVHEQEVVTTA
jgi:bifunctional non-homologous end joining protein LigD